MPGIVNTSEKTISFDLPVFSEPSLIDACISLDAGQSFSPPVPPPQIVVRAKPSLSGAWPPAISTEGGGEIVITGEGLKEIEGKRCYCRFAAAGFERKVKGSVSGGQVTCYAPVLREFNPFSPVELKVHVSLDSGQNWMQSDTCTITAHAAILLEGARPPSIPPGGGAAVEVVGKKLFASPNMAIRFVARPPAAVATKGRKGEGASSEVEERRAMQQRIAKGAGREGVGGVKVARAKYSASKGCAVCASPSLEGFEGGTCSIQLSVNGSDWYAVPGVLKIDSEGSGSASGTAASQTDVEELERLERARLVARARGMAARAKQLLAESEPVCKAPVGGDKGQGKVLENHISVGVVIGRNADGEHAVLDVVRGTSASREGLRKGDIVVGLREVWQPRSREEGKEEEEELLYVSRKLTTKDVKTLFGGPRGSRVTVVIKGGRQVRRSRARLIEWHKIGCLSRARGQYVPFMKLGVRSMMKKPYFGVHNASHRKRSPLYPSPVPRKYPDPSP